MIDDAYEEFAVQYCFTPSHFEIDEGFFEKISELVELKFEIFRCDVAYTAEELIGYHTWSEMMPHERDFAVIVLRQLALLDQFPIAEVPVGDGVRFRVLHINCDTNH